ncbi:MAG: hypothetical protein IT327_19385 [Anaerolineae bacterium]|nr:hypothetical protein [Anaerolineae bacterium]
MNNRRILMIVGGIVGLAALCCVGIIIFSLITDEDSGSPTRSLTALKTVCDGEAVAETAVYDPSLSGQHPAAIIQHVAGGESIFVSTAWGYHPNSLEEAELVVCLQDVVETVTETCEYDLEGGGEATITRVSLVADYQLIAAQTGEVVDEGSIKANPRQCQDEETFQDNLSFTLRGDFGEALAPQLADYLNTP